MTSFFENINIIIESAYFLLLQLFHEDRRRKMKKLSKLFTFVVSFLMALAPLFVLANDNVPDSTTITIHKLNTGATRPEENQLQANADGSAIDINSLDFTVTPMQGVKFQWFKVGDNVTVDTLSAMSLDQLKAAYTTTGTTAATDADGIATIQVDKANYGKYWIVELASGDVAASGAMQVTGTVPMLVTLPFGTETGYSTNVHVYPKNVTETPTTGKDVVEEGNNTSGQSVGDTVTWFLKGTVPVDIRNYKTYWFKDVLSEALDYSEVKSVKVGNETLTLTTDYTVEYTEATRTLLVKLTAAGITKLADYRDQNPNADYASSTDIQDATLPKVFVSVELDTVLNDKAVPGKPVGNKTTIIYENPYDPNGGPEETPESDEPKVHEGGKRFEKVDGTTTTKKLAGAEFELYSDSDLKVAVVWTQKLIDDNKAQTDNAAKFKDVAVGSPVILVSDENGSFEIQGLSYGTKGEAAETASSTYYLKEVKAPTGYTLPANSVVDFTVNQNSYYQDPTAVDLAVAEAKQVLNNKTPELPMTGGIGALIFVAFGLALMAFAGYKMKTRRA